MRNRKNRSVGTIAGAAIFAAGSSVVALGSAAAADLPFTQPQAQVAPPPRYAPPPNYPSPNYYARPPVADEEAYPPPAAYDYPAPPAYYAYAPPPVVVVPRSYYWEPNYWGRPFRGPFIARGYGHYERPFAGSYERFPEHGWGRRGW